MAEVDESGHGESALDIARMLWPPPHDVRPRGPGMRSVGMAMLPNARRTTRLVPDAHGRSTGTLTVGTLKGATPRARLRRRLFSAGGASGLLRLAPTRVSITEVPGGESLHRHLEEVFGQRLTIAVHLGPPRANRKPVLHLVDRSGTTVSFVKVGINEITSALVAAEGRALAQLAAHDLSALEVPRVLHAGVWRGHPLLAQSPLTGIVGAVPDGSVLARAMVEASRVLGVGTTSVARSPHLDRLAGAVTALESTHRPALERSLDHLRSTLGDVELATGTWHGDWTPWNMTATSQRVRVWDWERLTYDVPLGMDALHFEMQRQMRSSGSHPRIVAMTTLAERERLLFPWRISGETATATAVAYLLTLGVRYAADAQDRAGARLGDLDQWLIPALDALLAHDARARG